MAPSNKGGAVPATIYGQVTTYAGTGYYGSNNGPALSASFGNPTRITIDPNNNIYVADRDNNLIRLITSTGTVSTFASGLYQPNGVAVDANGNIFVADAGSQTIKKITPAGVVTTYAGTGSSGYANGSASSASFYYPYDVAVDNTGNVFVADAYNNAIRKITPAGQVSTIAGGTQGSANGTGAAAQFNHPNCVAIDAAGNLYISDPNNNLIREITPAGVVSTYAGTGAGGLTNGPASGATFQNPCGVAIGVAGDVFVADLSNNVIRRISPSGIVSTLAGSGTAGLLDGTGTSARFNRPNDVQYDGKGYLFVDDYGNDAIRKVCITGYTIDKPLPSGLTFDPTTGIISGTPTSTSPPTDYTVTAYNLSGSSSTIVNIQVVENQQLTFPPISNKTICSADFTPGATMENGAPITYTSSNETVAIILNGQIHIFNGGTTIITATSGTLTASQTLTVLDPPKPVVTIAADNINPCTGGTITFSATASNGGSNPIYQWQVNNIATGTNSSTYTSSTLEKTDTVRCIVTNNDICPEHGVSNIITGFGTIPYTSPSVSITSSVTGPVCPGSEITFTALATNAGTNPVFQWTVNGSNTGSNSPTFTSSTLKNQDQIQCIITNQTSTCLTSATAQSNVITVDLIPPPDPAPAVTISASADNVIIGTSITFTATVTNTSNINAYQWKVNGRDAGTNSPFFTTNTLKPGDTVTSEVNISGGCIASVKSPAVKPNLLGVPPIQIPNTFTPNGDGINDMWTIMNLNYYPNCYVYIYNRYGNIIFQSKNYPIPWNGTYKGQLVPEATYYYIINPGNGSANIAGSVTVLR